MSGPLTWLTKLLPALVGALPTSESATPRPDMTLASTRHTQVLPEYQASLPTSAPIFTSTTYSTASVSTIASNNTTSPLHFRAQSTLSVFNACAASQTDCVAGKSTFYGAVLSVDHTATILELGCAVSSNVTNCMPTPVTITQASNLYQRSSGAGYANSVSCSVASGQLFAKCVQANVTEAPVSDGSATSSKTVRSTATFWKPDMHYNAFVVTAGAEMLSANSTLTSISSAFATGFPIAAPVNDGHYHFIRPSIWIILILAWAIC